jgi:hypothetical protein
MAEENPLFPSRIVSDPTPRPGSCLRVPAAVMAEKARAQLQIVSESRLGQPPADLSSRLPTRAAPNQRSITMSYHRLFVRKPKIAETLGVEVAPLADFLRREGAVMRLDAANGLLVRRATHSMIVLDGRLTKTSDRILSYVRPRMKGSGPEASRLIILWANVIELVERRERFLQARRDKAAAARRDKEGRVERVASEKEKLEALKLLRAHARGEGSRVLDNKKEE